MFFYQKSLLIFPGTYYHFGITLFQDLLASKTRKSEKTCKSIANWCHSHGAAVSWVLVSWSWIDFLWAECLLLKLDWTSFGRVLLLNGRSDDISPQAGGSGPSSKRSHLSVVSFLNSINPHLLKENFREQPKRIWKITSYFELYHVLFL